MNFLKALTLFQGEVERVLAQGYEIKAVEAEPAEEDGEILVTALSPDGSVLVAVGVDRSDLLMGLAEFAFSQAAGQVEALHKLKTIAVSR